jgi:hypothetical protein
VCFTSGAQACPANNVCDSTGTCKLEFGQSTTDTFAQAMVTGEHAVGVQAPPTHGRHVPVEQSPHTGLRFDISNELSSV